MRDFKIPEQVNSLLHWLLIGLLLLTLVKIIDDAIDREMVRRYTESIEMAKKGFCKKTVMGDAGMQYQPCVVVKDY